MQFRELFKISMEFVKYISQVDFFYKRSQKHTQV